MVDTYYIDEIRNFYTRMQPTNMRKLEHYVQEFEKAVEGCKAVTAELDSAQSVSPLNFDYGNDFKRTAEEKLYRAYLGLLQALHDRDRKIDETTTETAIKAATDLYKSFTAYEKKVTR